MLYIRTPLKIIEEDQYSDFILSFCTQHQYSLPSNCPVKFITDWCLSTLAFSCKEPVEPLTLEEVADRCHAPEDVYTAAPPLPYINFLKLSLRTASLINFVTFYFLQIEMIYKIIAHMAANDRALIAEGNCGSPRSIKVFLGECNLDELYA